MQIAQERGAGFSRACKLRKAVKGDLLLGIERRERLSLPTKKLRTAIYLAVKILDQSGVYQRLERLTGRPGEAEEFNARQSTEAAQEVKQIRLLRRLAPPVFGDHRRVLGRDGKPRDLDILVLRAPLALLVEPHPDREHGLDRVIDRAEKAPLHKKRELYLRRSEYRFVVKNGTYGFEPIAVAVCGERKHHALARPVPVPERDVNAHTRLHPARKRIGDEVVVRPVH